MHCLFRILHATLFIMSFLAESINRAPGKALPAGIMAKMKAIGMMILIGSCVRRDVQSSDYGTYPHGLANRGNQTVTKPKGTESCCIRRMPLRPV